MTTQTLKAPRPKANTTRSQLVYNIETAKQYLRNKDVPNKEKYPTMVILRYNARELARRDTRENQRKTSWSALKLQEYMTPLRNITEAECLDLVGRDVTIKPLAHY